VIAPKIDEEDILMAVELQRFMESQLWKYLKKQYQAKREAIILAGKKCRKDESAMQKFGELAGYDQAVQLPYDIIDHVKRFKRGDDEGEEIDA